MCDVWIVLMQGGGIVAFRGKDFCHRGAEAQRFRTDVETDEMAVLRFCFVLLSICPFTLPFLALFIAWVSNLEGGV